MRRSLNYLARVGLFDGVRAVIFAGFTLIKPHFAATEFEAIFNVLKTFSKETLRALSVPAYYTPNISHGLDNFPLPFCQLSLGQPTLAQPDIGMKESAQK